jgi:hypothetical protein
MDDDTLTIVQTSLEGWAFEDNDFVLPFMLPSPS